MNAHDRKKLIHPMAIHDPHLGRGQLVRDPVDVNQLHVGLDAQLCGDGQPG